MTMKREDGGAAFSRPDDRDPTTGEGIREGSPGMSLRDYFAGQALMGQCAVIDEFGGKTWAEDMARQSYLLADAMLAERKKP